MAARLACVAVRGTYSSDQQSKSTEYCSHVFGHNFASNQNISFPYGSLHKSVPREQIDMASCDKTMGYLCTRKAQYAPPRRNMHHGAQGRLYFLKNYF